MSRINDENATAFGVGTPIPMTASARRTAWKNQYNGDPSKRKQAFGDLNNFVESSTPLNKFSNAFRPSVTICNDIFRKHQQPKVEPRKRIKYLASNSMSITEEDEEENLFDYMDFNKCTGTCAKTDREIWSEQNLFDDDLINKILHNDCNNNELENIEDSCHAENLRIPLVDEIDLSNLSIANFITEDYDDTLAVQFPDELDLNIPYDPFVFERHN